MAHPALFRISSPTATCSRPCATTCDDSRMTACLSRTWSRNIPPRRTTKSGASSSLIRRSSPSWSTRRFHRDRRSFGDAMGTHDYPLLIKNLMLVPLRQPNGHGIVYRDLTRYDYKSFGERVGRLGSALAALGVRKGDTIAVMDWDTPRYLESFFAIPMIGAVLQTVNVRLPPEQVQYTLEHAEASVVLCNTEFLGLLK